MVTATSNEQSVQSAHLEWAFLLHRLPREPSAPRIALWRALRRFGAVMLGDGLSALPANARTVEHLEWLAAGIVENGGTGSVWIARPTTRRTADALVESSRASAEAEYRALIGEAGAAADPEAAEIKRVVRRLRRQLRVIGARDYFAAPSGPRARQVVEDLALPRVAA